MKKTTLQEEIYNKISSSIQSGKLKSGRKLASIRNYAEENGISCNTVQAAYNRLCDEGYIYSKEKSGYFVSDFETPYINAPKTTKKLHEKIPENKTEKKINLSSDMIDSSIFPFSTLRKLFREALSGKNSSLLDQTGDFCGETSLKKEICDYVWTHRGIACEPGQIVIGSGTALLLQTLIKLFEKYIGKGLPEFYLEKPCFSRTEKIICDEGCTVHAVPLDKNGIDIAKIACAGLCKSGRMEQGAGIVNRAGKSVRPGADARIAVHSKGRIEDTVTILHITPTHQFPTGITMNAPRRAAVLKWAYEKENRFIIEDDYDSDYRYNGRPIPALYSMDKKARIIYMGTFSRTLTPSVRISFLVLPENLAKIYRKNFNYYSCSVSRVDQIVLAEFMRQGFFERHINRTKKVYRTKRDKMISLLKESFPKIEISGMEAGLHFIIKTSSLVKNEKKLIEEAAKKNLIIRTTGNGFLIIGYAHLNESAIEKAVSILKQTVSELT